MLYYISYRFVVILLLKNNDSIICLCYYYLLLLKLKIYIIKKNLNNFRAIEFQYYVSDTWHHLKINYYFRLLYVYNYTYKLKNLKKIKNMYFTVVLMQIIECTSGATQWKVFFQMFCSCSSNIHYFVLSHEVLNLELCNFYHLLLFNSLCEGKCLY